MNPTTIVVHNVHLEELSSCPRCGEQPLLIEYRNDRVNEIGKSFVVEHRCRFLTFFPDSKENAIKLWNHRC